MISLHVTEAAALAIIEQADYYRSACDQELADRWDASVDDAIRSLLRFPERGAPCRFDSPELAGLRWIPVKGFPKHLVFYRFLSEQDAILVVHIVHGARNLQALLREGE